MLFKNNLGERVHACMRECTYVCVCVCAGVCVCVCVTLNVGNVNILLQLAISPSCDNFSKICCQKEIFNRSKLF